MRVRHLVAYSGCGYVHLLTRVVPGFRALGVSEREPNTTFTDNPGRLLAFEAA